MGGLFFLAALVAAAVYLTNKQTIDDAAQSAVDEVTTIANPTHVQRSMDLLEEDFRWKVEAYIRDCAALDPPVYLIVTETGRTPERQQMLYSQGLSHTLHSKHLINPATGKCRAADTLTRDFQDTPDGNYELTATLQRDDVKALRDEYELKNLPSISDFDHLEDLFPHV